MDATIQFVARCVDSSSVIDMLFLHFQGTFDYKTALDEIDRKFTWGWRLNEASSSIWDGKATHNLTKLYPQQDTVV